MGIHEVFERFATLLDEPTEVATFLKLEGKDYFLVLFYCKNIEQLYSMFDSFEGRKSRDFSEDKMWNAHCLIPWMLTLLLLKAAKPDSAGAFFCGHVLRRADQTSVFLGSLSLLTFLVGVLYFLQSDILLRQSLFNYLPLTLQCRKL